mgnify:CR=1 FL=1
MISRHLRTVHLPLRIAFAGLVLLLNACATAPVTSRRVEVEHPQSVAGFKREDIVPAEDPQVGTRIRYSSPNFDALRIDLFAYVVGTSDDIEGTLDLIREGFESSMDYAVEHGAYKRIEWLGSENLLVPISGRQRPARFLRNVQESQNGFVQMSHTYLMYRPPFALKVRASFPVAGNTGYNEAIREFVFALMPEIKVTMPAACTDIKIVFDPHEEGACELMEKLLQSSVYEGLRGCEDYESVADTSELMPQILQKCRADDQAEKSAPGSQGNQ